ncbi:MAG: hypothetical protein PT939_05790 [Aerococcus suis]|nr:hypothetical protein [Aerococcus suis]
MSDKKTNGILYLLTTEYDDIVKIGSATFEEFEEIEKHVKSDLPLISGLNLAAAINTENYLDKEDWIYSLLDQYRVSKSTLFNIDNDDVLQLFLNLKGERVYPSKKEDKKIIKRITESRDIAAVPDGEYYFRPKKWRCIFWKSRNSWQKDYCKERQ